MEKNETLHSNFPGKNINKTIKITLEKDWSKQKSINVLKDNRIYYNDEWNRRD